MPLVLGGRILNLRGVLTILIFTYGFLNASKVLLSLFFTACGLALSLALSAETLAKGSIPALLV